MLHMLEDLERERDAIRTAREDWINTVDAVRNPMMVHDAAGRIVRANRAYAERSGMDFRALIGRPYWECFPKGEGPLPGCAPEELFAAAGRTAREQEFVLPGGEVFVSRVFIVPRGTGGPHALHLLEDVTDKKAAEKRIRALNTLYATLSAVNHAMVHSRTRHEIAERIVHIGTQVGPWHGAWMGFLDRASGRLGLEAWSPSIAPFIGRIDLSADDSGVPYFCNDVLADPAAQRWESFAREAGISSVAAIPLGSSAPGVLNLCSRDKEIFTPEVRALVLEMADDITYALEMLDTERHRRLAESALLDNQAKLRRALVATVEAITATVEARDPYTAGHQRRVSDLAQAIAREMGLEEPALEGIHFGAQIHDLGKIQVPAEILAKPTRLSKLEFELIKTHPQAGYDIVKGIEFPWPVADMVRQHHERLDGSGYPQGLKGEAIALEARILAVADVVEAMASHRPYRASLGLDAALKEIEAKRGIWFDDKVVDACLRLFREKGFSGLG
jgi:PAS domain S-box-containing protein